MGVQKKRCLLQALAFVTAKPSSATPGKIWAADLEQFRQQGELSSEYQWENFCNTSEYQWENFRDTVDVWKAVEVEWDTMVHTVQQDTFVNEPFPRRSRSDEIGKQDIILQYLEAYDHSLLRCGEQEQDIEREASGERGTRY